MTALVRLALLAHAVFVPAAGALATQKSALVLRANPIRKVVNMLQAMQKKVTEEGEKSEQLLEKFMCYCKSSGSSLTAGISAAQTKVPELQSGIQSKTGQKTQLESDLKGHQSDRQAANAAMSEATVLRAKEKAAFDKELAESQANSASLGRALDALEKGMGGSFLQTTAAATLKSFVMSNGDMADADRDEVLSFLSGQQGEDSAPASGEILGIMKQMQDEMSKTQAENVADEESAVKDHEALMSAKRREVAALSEAVEEKLSRVGEISIELATMKNDLEDTSEALAEDQAFAADMKKDCDKKGAVHKQEKKMRAQEVVALADTISTLNSDDALDLFKKTLPSASASLVQVQESSTAWRARAKALFQGAKAHLKSGRAHQRLNFILLALHGKKVGFEKVLQFVDELVVTLKSEQVDDDDKQSYCAKELEEADDKKKDLTRSAADTETVIEEAKEGIAKLTEEIGALKDGIVALDKEVAEATELRQAESKDYKELMQSDGAAKELLLYAKNRLHKFYNAKLAAALAQERSEGDVAFTQLTSRTRRGAPPPPPETAAAYKKKASESGGVVAMMDLLISDLDKEMAVAETEEKNAQEEYKEIIAESAEKRAQDSKSLTGKEAAKAELEGALEESESNKKSTATELMGLDKFISALHSDCDWLVQYYNVRKVARTDEIDSLEKAKAVLSGADYSLVQTGHTARSRKFLRHA